MKQKTLAKLASASVAAALLMGSSVAFAQTVDYGTGGAASGSAGTIVPTAGNNNTPGITDPNGVGASGATGTTPGVPNTGTSGTGGTSTTPGVPNTGVGETAAAALAMTGAVALAAGYLLYRRNQDASLA